MKESLTACLITTKKDTQRLQDCKNVSRSSGSVTLRDVLTTNGGPYIPVLRKVTVDRPFTFALVKLTSRTILFLGQKMQ